MGTGTPVVAPSPEASQEVSQAGVVDKAAEAKNNLKIIELLNTVHYLLVNGQFKGDDAELVIAARRFCIDMKGYLEAQGEK